MPLSRSTVWLLTVKRHFFRHTPPLPKHCQVFLKFFMDSDATHFPCILFSPSSPSFGQEMSDLENQIQATIRNSFFQDNGCPTTWLRYKAEGSGWRNVMSYIDTRTNDPGDKYGSFRSIFGSYTLFFYKDIVTNNGVKLPYIVGCDRKRRFYWAHEALKCFLFKNQCIHSLKWPLNRCPDPRL